MSNKIQKKIKDLYIKKLNFKKLMKKNFQKLNNAIKLQKLIKIKYFLQRAVKNNQKILMKKRRNFNQI